MADDYDPNADPELQTALGEMDAARDQDAANRANAAFKAAAPSQQDQPSGLQHWFTDLPQNVGSGLMSAAINTADAAHSGWKWVNQGQQEAFAKLKLASPGATKPEAEEQAEGVQTPEYSAVRSAVQAFKSKYIDVQNPTMSDSVTQGIAQFALPFLGYSKAVSAVGGAGKLVAAGRTMLAESATAGTAMAPHDGRFADMLDLGRHTEGKFADALNAISPDGSAVNNYINYMTADRDSEGEFEGRMKNIVDTLTGGAVISPLIHTGMTMLKGGMAGLKYSIANGVASVDQLGIPNQAGRIGYHGTPHNFDVDAGFNNDAIGSGEGNQAFGYGHYLAENRSVAKQYQGRLTAQSYPGMMDAQSALKAANDDPVRAYKDLSGMAADEQDSGLRMRMQRAASLIKSGNYKRGSGSLITADIPDEHVDKMIDWDKPLADQHQVVRDAFNAHGIGGEEDITGREAYQALSSKFEENGAPRGDVAASALLNMRGVPGVKYLDGNSRAGTEGTRNLVLFNGKDAKILKKE